MGARKKNKTFGGYQTPGYNSYLAEFIKNIMPKNPLRYDDLNEMKLRFQHYFETCIACDRKVTNMGAYLAIGISKEIARDWANDTKNIERRDFIRSVENVCSVYREALMADGELSVPVGIFWQKNFDGFRDQVEVINTQGQNLGDLISEKNLENKYLSAVQESDTTDQTEGTDNQTEKVDNVQAP